MKKQITLPALAICTCLLISLNAQTEKGDWLVGGQLALSTVENNSQFLLNPNVGYFFANNLALGANVGLAFEKVGATNFRSMNIGPLARFYVGRGEFRPFLNANANVASQRSKVGSASSTVNGFSWLAGVGLAWFVTDNAALETVIGYSSTKLEKNEATDGMALRVGFQVYFDRYAAEKMGVRTNN